MLIYHMARAKDWAAAEEDHPYAGSDQDRRDGFIHFSTADQVVESAARHRAGEAGLVLLAVDSERLGAALRWERSRNGALFPHLYAALPPSAVIWSAALPLGPDGRHVFPTLEN